jgi:hypothetical protein
MRAPISPFLSAIIPQRPELCVLESGVRMWVEMGGEDLRWEYISAVG